MTLSSNSRKKTKSERKIIAIVGPTASGKSELAVRLALWIKKNRKALDVSGAEILSADSRQVYKGLNIGSGKITKRETRGVKHWLLDVASPKKVFTAHDYQKKGNRILNDIFKRGVVPIICGGTGFYIDSILYSPFIPEVPPQKKLRKELEKLSLEELLLRLRKIDPKRRETIDMKNKRRLVRAVEVAETLGGPVPERKKTLRHKTLIMGIRMDREELSKKIKNRLIKRIKAGMIKEVSDLHYKDGVSWKRMEDLGLEYGWTSRYLRGAISLEEMVSGLEKDIIRYAKRQVTWFKKENGIIWLDNYSQAAKNSAKFLKIS